jgi:phosphoenolpyruvate carboxykinase (GTP)
VNWFRRGTDGSFLWPGFGDNARVLAWVFGRCAGTASATETPIGFVPSIDDLDLDGLTESPQTIAAALAVNPDEWRAEANSIAAYYDEYGERLPEELRDQLAALHANLR